ncbi:hypothetical protein SEVIR_8G069700v4 [Setaria viridis]|uniref:Cytochrome P450 n=1 Tax=Setaria viridis TaxID=4556 RepID=A0A4U6TCM5_SETVI|nr:dolabradiene monooxygenase-like [Setaria viridis]TKV99830.1 hypothetical protein SEVIR_8G069700v2 [Setaria viridis]
MEDKALLAAVSVFALLVVLSKLKSLLVTKPKLNLPPGPWTLPVIGSLHHLVTSPNFYRAMRRLAQKHGPVMMLRLGEIPMLVASSPEAAMEVMKTHDIIFADRYRNPTINALAFDGDEITFAPYGERWRQLRKICTLELLSTARVQSLGHIREDEVARFMENIAASAGAGAAVDVTKMISRFINDTIVRESVGSRSKYQDEFIDAMHTALHQTSGLAVADLFPSSRLMRFLDTAPRKVLACRKRMERIVEQVIEEKKEAMDRGDDGQAVAGHDGFLNVLLRLQKERSTPIPVTNDIIVKLVFDMVGAGTDTSSTMLNWCMTELVRSPAVMAKAQAEVRKVFKGKSAITEDDLKGLSYLKLVMKEALRLRTPGPLLVPRLCRETCKVMGYDIPKGTVVFTNVWAICRDPKYWDDPEEFKPERFENSHLDYKGTCYEFLPFGAGRRICPGINLGVANVELALASLIYHFDWKLPAGMKPEDIDVMEVPGLVARKKTSLILHPVTRIHPVNA